MFEFCERQLVEDQGRIIPSPHEVIYSGRQQSKNFQFAARIAGKYLPFKQLQPNAGGGVLRRRDRDLADMS